MVNTEKVVDGEEEEYTGPAYLDILINSKNKEGDAALGKENYSLNPQLCSSSDLAHLNFLGVLMGVCMRTNTVLSIELPTIFWKSLVGQKIDINDLAAWDSGLLSTLKNILNCDKETFEYTFEGLKFTIALSDDREVPVEEGGEDRERTFENRFEYVKKALITRMKEFQV